VSESPGVALALALLAQPAGGTGAGSVLRIAGSVVLAVAHLGAVLSKVVEVTGTIALYVLPAGGAAALTRLRLALGSILAVAAQGAILAKEAGRTALLAGGSLPARRTQAGSIDRRALGSVLAVAGQFAVGSIAQEGARPGALGTAPSDAAVALPRVRVAQFGVIHVALAGAVAVQSVLVRLADPFPALGARPAGIADARSIGPIAGGIVLAVAGHAAVESVRVQRTLVEAALSQIARWALALSCDVVAWGSLVALAGLLASGSVAAHRTLVGAHIARPAGIAHAGPALRLALSVVLAGTVLLALGAMFPVRTAHVASSWSGGLVGGFGRISGAKLNVESRVFLKAFYKSLFRCLKVCSKIF